MTNVEYVVELSKRDWVSEIERALPLCAMEAIKQLGLTIKPIATKMDFVGTTQRLGWHIDFNDGRYHVSFVRPEGAGADWCIKEIKRQLQAQLN